MPQLTAREVAEPNTILKCLVGSTLHGLALEGTDDTDLMGVCIEPPEFVLGLSRVRSSDGILRPFEQWVDRTQPEGARSGAGDVDLVVYSLRKYVRLAANGNPSVLMLLFAPEKDVVESDLWGRALRAHVNAIVSRHAGPRFLGYLRKQKERLLGERGQMRVKRPELIEEYGFDTKYAMHMLRLGYQGIEFMRTGKITLPMPYQIREQLLSVRRGGWSFEHVVRTVADLERELADAIEASELPEHPNREALDAFLVSAYQNRWVRS